MSVVYAMLEKTRPFITTTERIRMTQEHLQPHVNDRGFTSMEKIESPYGSTIQAYESSGMTPAIWVQSFQPASNRLDDQDADVMVLLPLEEARQLRDQIDTLIKNHFTHELYGDASTEEN